MSELKTSPSHWEINVRKNTLRLLCWTGAWTATVAVLAFGPPLIWHFNTLLTIFAIIINVSVGIGMIIAHIRHLNGSDEMQQKNVLEAAALTLGVGLVCGGSYQLWKDIQLISFEPEISHLMILMGLTFMASLLVGHWRSR